MPESGPSGSVRGAVSNDRPYRDVRQETGEELRMREPYDEGLANRIGPAPCVGAREGTGEASERGCVGWVLSRESDVRGADPVGKWGRQHGPGRPVSVQNGEPRRRPRVVIDPKAHADTPHRELGDLPSDRLNIGGPHRGGASRSR